MKLQVVAIAFMLFLAAGLFLFITPVAWVKPLFNRSIEKSVVPDDSDNSNPDKRPVPQDKKRPERIQPRRLHTIMVIIQMQQTPPLHPAANEI